MRGGTQDCYHYRSKTQRCASPFRIILLLIWARSEHQIIDTRYKRTLSSNPTPSGTATFYGLATSWHVGFTPESGHFEHTP